MRPPEPSDVEAFVRRWAETMKVPLIESRQDISGEILDVVPSSWCLERGVILLTDGTILALNREHLASAKEKLRERGVSPKIRPVHPRLFHDLLDDLKRNTVSDAGVAKSEVQEKYHQIIQQAMAQAVSDIHIEVRPRGTQVRYRQHGLCKHAESFSQSLGRAIAEVLFNVGSDSGRSVYNPRLPQDASMKVTINGTNVRLRLASLPAHPGDSIDVVIRILAGQGRSATLEKLGYSSDHIRLLKGAVARPHGMILVAGPTGSGKSTTLAAVTNLFDGQQKTITIEDPPEYEIPHATQVPADTDSEEKNFAAIGRGTLRMDPDNVIIGEIRDEETAQIAVRLAITGHRVVSTIHVNNAINVVARLADLGVSLNTLADPDLLVALLYQRLVPTLCPKCSLAFTANRNAFEKFMPKLVARLDQCNIAPDKVQFRGEGCPHCRRTAVSGRTVVAEVIYIDRKGRSFIANGASAAWEAHLIAQGWQPLRKHLLSKVEEGLVSPLDAEDIIGSLVEDGIEESFNYTADLQKLGGER